MKTKQAKRGNLLDRGFATIVDTLSTELERENIPYAIVGGVATQLHIARLLSNNGQEDYMKHQGLPYLLRTTGDIDMATHSDDVTMVSFFNRMNDTIPHLTINNQVRHAGITSEGIRIFANYQTDKSQTTGLENLYDAVINSAQPIRLRRGKQEITATVIKPEFLVATKVLRSKSKDSVDLHNLLQTMENQGEELDIEEVRAALKASGHEDKYERLQSALNTIHTA